MALLYQNRELGIDRPLASAEEVARNARHFFGLLLEGAASTSEFYDIKFLISAKNGSECGSDPEFALSLFKDSAPSKTLRTVQIDMPVPQVGYLPTSATHLRLGWFAPAGQHPTYAITGFAPEGPYDEPAERLSFAAPYNIRHTFSVTDHNRPTGPEDLEQLPYYRVRTAVQTVMDAAHGLGVRTYAFLDEPARLEAAYQKTALPKPTSYEERLHILGAQAFANCILTRDFALMDEIARGLPPAPAAAQSVDDGELERAVA